MFRPSLVRQMVRHFAELAGWEGDRIVVTASRKTFDRAALRGGAPCVSSDDEGATLITDGRVDPEPAPLIWISPALRDARVLARICAHEALHAASPSMPHGRPFDNAVRKLLRGVEL